MGSRCPATLILGVTLSLGSGFAAAADFVAYESKDSVREGTGGEKKTVDGIDFWANGAPPRKFQIIGFITDSRLKTGLIGMMRMSGLESSVAQRSEKSWWRCRDIGGRLGGDNWLRRRQSDEYPRHFEHFR